MSLTIESASTVGIPSSIGSSARPRSGIVVHYVGGSPISRGAHTACRQQVRNWHSYHRNGQGWAGLGYHYAICHHGIVMTGRGLNRVGAHAPGANATHVGVLIMLGGTQQPTADQLAGFRSFRSWLGRQGVGTGVTPHSRWVSTSCPGTHLRSRISSNNWGSGGTPGGPGTGGTGEDTTPTDEGDDQMLGLRRGATGQRVRSLQTYLRDAGYPPANSLKKDGEYDGVYGKGVADAVLELRRDQGSDATSGDHISYWARNQMRRAWFQAQMKDAGGPPSGGGGGSLPSSETVTVSGRLTVER